ncbi:hypothetical protein [Pedobacter aquatilis]|uniref:hypothetical protein n=1 Tax=Pedobacter aquatilis TaxID=351343 RepID=UPI00292FFD29|nr:hypothetical protein [Pedobacter aquatilis]
MKRILILIFAINMIVGCSKEKHNEQSGPEIRLSNSSQHNFKNVIVNTGTGEVSFGDLDSGKQTGYKKFSEAYRYAFVKLEIDGRSYTVQPIDFVGEKPLSNGRYAYQLSVNANQGQYNTLNLKLIEE